MFVGISRKEDPLLAHPLATQPLDKVSALFSETNELMEGLRIPGKYSVHVLNPLSDELLRRSMGNVSPSQSYEIAVLTSVQTIASCLESNGVLADLIRTPPENNYLSTIGISRETWIHAQFSSFVINSISAFDACLSLCNEVFILGLDTRDTTTRQVLSNRWIRDTPVGTSLKSLDSTLRELRRLRNRSLHETPLIATDLDLLLKLSEVAAHIDHEVISKETGEDLVEILRVKLATYVVESTDAIRHRATDLLDSLLPVYQVRSESLPS